MNDEAMSARAWSYISALEGVARAVHEMYQSTVSDGEFLIIVSPSSADWDRLSEAMNAAVEAGWLPNKSTGVPS